MANRENDRPGLLLPVASPHSFRVTTIIDFLTRGCGRSLEDSQYRVRHRSAIRGDRLCFNI